MTGLPTVQVLVDDGTGTYPTNITSKTRLPEGITWTRGRGDELSSNTPGTASFTWDNTDGTLTPFGVSGLACDQGVRIKVNGANRWTGRLSSVPVAWPSGGQEFAVIGATATDAGAALGRITVLGAADQESTLDTGLVAYYPMQEDSAATFTRDDSGANQPNLKLVKGNTGSSSFAAPVQPGTTVGDFGTGLLDGATGWQAIGGSGTTPPILQSPTALNALSATRITFVYYATTPSSTISLVKFTDPVSGVAGDILFAYGVSTATFTANNLAPLALNGGIPIDIVPHAFTYQGDASGQDIWIDGVKLATNASAFSSFPNGFILSVGDASLLNLNSFIISRLSIGNVRIPDARIPAIHSAILNDFLGETPEGRLARLLTYVDGITAGSLDSAGDTVLGLAAQAGKNVADLANDATGADLGQVFIDKDGKLSSISGQTTAGLTSPVTLDANWFSEDTQFIVDMFGVVNSATGKSSYTQNVVMASDPTSITAHELYPQDFEWDVSTDAQALDRTNWMISSYSEPTPRVGSLTLDMLTLDATNLSHALTLDLGSWLSITGLPSQTPGGTTADFIVEQITEAISIDSWTLTMNVASRDVVGAWILGDSTWGVLGTTTRLYV